MRFRCDLFLPIWICSRIKLHCSCLECHRVARSIRLTRDCIRTTQCENNIARRPQMGHTKSSNTQHIKSIQPEASRLYFIATIEGNNCSGYHGCWWFVRWRCARVVCAFARNSCNGQPRNCICTASIFILRGRFPRSRQPHAGQTPTIIMLALH